MTKIRYRLDILPHSPQVKDQWNPSSTPMNQSMLCLWESAFADDDALTTHQYQDEYQEYEYEYSWTSGVHARLLDLVLGNEEEEEKKLIDICLYKHEDLIAQLAHTHAHDRAHTRKYYADYDFFDSVEPVDILRPVITVLSVEPSVHWNAAEIQMRIHHARLWASLRRRAVKRKTSTTLDEDDNNNTNTTDETKNEHDTDLLSQVPFIPGIIAQGHEWHLVLSTYEDGGGNGNGKKNKTTTLFTASQFLSTQECMDAYSVVAGIRRLAAWARDVYIPWFTSHVDPGDRYDSGDGALI
ncbi:hypothetical protein F5Y17DRAFT_470921 [Xylariaceae sp. FL0594]|nr:hypothetical protein F5Y17DRAFT_470921 [Xylariaceae sp. FL0594]